MRNRVRWKDGRAEYRGVLLHVVPTGYSRPDWWWCADVSGWSRADYADTERGAKRAAVNAVDRLFSAVRR